ncbi:MAG: squalene/phytoene synthase family protein [Ginsengibacter sp.]
MKSLFDDISVKCSKLTTRAYSTSFTLGNRLRNPIYSIYGFVRFADEIVDSFHGYNKKYLLQKFRSDTFEAIENRISLNPILNSFQLAVHRYNIDVALIDTFY